MVYGLYRTAVLGVFGSLFIISIMFDNTPLYISRDPSIESIISTAEDVGRVGNRKEEIGDR
jgi:hypothetical protein